MNRMKLALALVGAAVVGSGTALAWPRSAPGADSSSIGSAVVTYEAEGFRYEYHVPTGHESLFDVRKGGPALTNVLRGNEQRAAMCRRALEAKLGVTDIQSLRSRYDESVRRLQALGYL